MSSSGPNEPGEPAHPDHGAPLDPLERALWRFRLVGHEATVLCRGFKTEADAGRDVNADLKFVIANQSLLIVSKFREVWNEFGRLASTDARVVSARRATQPIVDRIDVWTGLRTHRNTTLAHAYLDSTDAILPPTSLIRDGTVPTFHAEILLLVHLVVHATAVVLQAFEDCYVAIDPVTRDAPATVVEKGPGIESGDEIDAELGAVMDRVSEVYKAEFGVPLGGRIVETFRAALNRPSRQ